MSQRQAARLAHLGSLLRVLADCSAHVHQMNSLRMAPLCILASNAAAAAAQAGVARHDDDADANIRPPGAARN